MASELEVRSAPPRIDLTTVRDTLRYMRDDMASLPELARIEQALSNAIDEISAVERFQIRAQTPNCSTIVPLARMNFVPWRPR